MNPTLFLIAHKVRGAAAFDIATPLEGTGTASDPGPWWIIPTSGHRAYPYAFFPLEGTIKAAWLESTIANLPPELPDHYTMNDRPKPPSPPTRRAAAPPLSTLLDI